MKKEQAPTSKQSQKCNNKKDKQTNKKANEQINLRLMFGKRDHKNMFRLSEKMFINAALYNKIKNINTENIE